jgi:anti-sigma regulatory factor (Ser/Thr protein kinase)
MSTITGSRRCFSHEALFYSGMEGFLEATTRFVGEGVRAGEDVLVSVSADKIERLRSALNDDDRVQFLDISVVGRNPGRIIPAWKEFVAYRGDDDRPVRGVGEPIWPERRSDELVESQHHESLLNVAFAQTPRFRLLCPYDVATLRADVIVEAKRSHPYVLQGEGCVPCAEFRGVSACAAPRRDALPPAPASATEISFTAAGLPDLRDVITSLTSESFPPERVADARLAISELCGNTVRHGGGQGTLRAWQEGSSWVFEVTDKGVIGDPLAGRIPPRADQVGGFGLWLVHRLCDLVQQRQLDSRNVTRVRIAAHGSQR